MLILRFKKIFITGGAGYVGSALVPRLLEKGYEVIVFDSYIYEYTFDFHKNLKQIKGDIRDTKKIIECSKGADAFLHLACVSNDPSFDLDPELGKSINYDAFKNIIISCKENKIKRLIVASSTSQYGVKPENIDVTEETEPEPITDYAKYKIECERLLEKENLNETEYVFVRPATICGYAPRLRLDISVNILTMNALINNKIKVFGGSQIRPALNIKDMVRFYELMLEIDGEKINKQAFNISYKNYSMLELANIVKKNICNDLIELEIIPTNDPRSYHVNTDKMRKVLNFECKHDIADAIKSLVDAYNKGIIIDGLNNPLYHNVKKMKTFKFEKSIDSLEIQTKKIRQKIIEISHKAKASHIGSSLSCVDILAILYWKIMSIDPLNQKDPNRDRFILSKGHAATALYVTLAERGFFPLEILNKYLENGTTLMEHPPFSNVPGIEVATGSLGHGLSIGTGIALAGKTKNENFKVYVLMSDGECNEGSVWEAAMLAASQKIDNLIAIIDYNKWQATGRSNEVMKLENLSEKWRTFGWNVFQVDGHNLKELNETLNNIPKNLKKPSIIIANTVKGKGVSFMEDDNNWHYKIPSEEELEKAKKELQI